MIYVIGAGLSGLSAGVWLAANGVPVQVMEAAASAGGRCRSYHDAQVGITIDNGNHLILSGNNSAHKFLATIGAEQNFIGPAEAEFAFHEIPTGKSWTVRPNEGMIPWWIFDRNRRVPDTQARDYASFVPLIRSGSRTAAELRQRDGVLWRRMLRPVLLATLNSEPEEAAPQLIGAILLGTLGRGGRACRPRIASPTLSTAFIDPALRFIANKGGGVHFGRRLLRIGFEHGQISELEFLERRQPMEAGDAVILAVPAWTAKALVPGIAAPTDHRAIVSTHFALRPPEGSAVITGIIGGTAEWIFCFRDRISVTISNADRLLDSDRNQIAQLCWDDVVRSLGISHEMPPWQVIKERRATFAATPEQEKKRPGAVTAWPNLFVAGDWTATGLPATIEGAIRSGRRAARLARRHHAA